MLVVDQLRHEEMTQLGHNPHATLPILSRSNCSRNVKKNYTCNSNKRYSSESQQTACLARRQKCHILRCYLASSIRRHSERELRPLLGRMWRAA